MTTCSHAYALRQEGWDLYHRANGLHVLLADQTDADLAAAIREQAERYEAQSRAKFAEAEALVRPAPSIPTGREECGKCGATGKVASLIDAGTCWDCHGRGWL